MTHAQYDGGSFPLLSKDLFAAYDGQELQAAPLQFSHYLRYRMCHKSSEAHKFWKEYLADSEMIDIQTLCQIPQSLNEKATLVKPRREIPPPSTPHGITTASLVKAAWAVVLARASKKKDVVFGHIINGRDAPLQDVDSISGPCITISPFKVAVQDGCTVLDLLNHVQNQYIRSMPYGNMDFKDIVKHATSWPHDTDFGSILTHQDTNIDMSGAIGGVESQWKNLDLGIQPQFHVVTHQVGDKLLVQFGVPSNRMHSDDAERIIDQFCQVITEFSSNTQAQLEL